MTNLNDGDDLDIAHEKDFGVQRDEDGELLPVKQRIPGTDKAIKCQPLTGGAVDEYAAVLEGQSTDAERVADLLRSHIVEGIGADATPEKVEHEYPGYLVPGLIQALKNSSGHDVFVEVQAQRNEEIKPNAELIEMLGGAEGLQSLADLDGEL
jgi:hypothetical protein